MAEAELRLDMTTGVDESTNELFPSWPWELSPQHLPVPLPSSAHELEPPANTAAAVVPELTPSAWAGVGASWPDPFTLAPQHFTVLSASCAQACCSPAGE